MKRTIARPRVGDKLWRVEWCAELAFDEAGDVDRDRCKMRTKCFKTRDEARAFAEQTWPATEGIFGLVEVDEIEFVPYDGADAARWPHVGYWDTVGDGEIFSDEWE